MVPHCLLLAAIAMPADPVDARVAYRADETSNIEYVLTADQDGQPLTLTAKFKVTVKAVRPDGTADLEIDPTQVQLMSGAMDLGDMGFTKLTLAFDKYGLPSASVTDVDRGMLLMVFSPTALPAVSVNPLETYKFDWKRDDGLAGEMSGKLTDATRPDGMPTFESTTVLTAPDVPKATVTSTAIFDPKRGFVVQAEGTFEAEGMKGKFTFRRS